jgi:hypothetical protein
MDNKVHKTKTIQWTIKYAKQNTIQWTIKYTKQGQRKSIGFQILLRTKYVPSLVKIHWRMLILECSQGCYAVQIWPSDFDLWPWKSIGFQTLIRTKYVRSLVKIHWKMLILECSQGCYVVKIWPSDLDHWPMTLKINSIPDSPKD